MTFNGYPVTTPESKTIIYSKRISTHRSFYLTALAITIASIITNIIWINLAASLKSEPIKSPLFPEPQFGISFDKDNATAISAIKKIKEIDDEEIERELRRLLKNKAMNKKLLETARGV